MDAEVYRLLAGNSTTDDHHDAHEHAHPHHELALFAPMVVLAGGALFRQFTKIIDPYLPIPYTVVLLLFGMFIGALIRENSEEDFMKSANIVGGLDPHLLLHIFLPPLIFESAFSIEWHVFNKSKWSTLFLAGPGLLISTSICGAVANALFWSRGVDECTAALECECTGKSWSSDAGYLMGVVLSATDPVAVVALLRELGVKAELSTAIEGESLFNDGTALVVFQVLAEIVKGAEEQSPEAVLRTFVYMSGGGILWGVFVGFVSVLWIGVVFNDAIIEITITVVAAYLTFFCAEYFFKVSGVLAVVALGLYCGRYGRMRISPEVQHFLEEFWEMLAYFGNTLIFTIAGIVVALHTFGKFDAWDLGMLFIIYFTLLLGRIGVFALLFCMKKAHGTPPAWQDYAVSVWGGLRGAVGLALGLFVWKESEICDNVGDKILFHCAGIVVLTVVVNGVSMRNVLSILKMNVVSQERKMVIKDAYQRVAEKGLYQESLLRADSLFDSAVWAEVRKYYLFSDVMEESKKRKNNNKKKQPGISIGLSLGAAKVLDVTDDKADLQEARRRVLMVCKQSYWNQFQEGLLGQEAVRFLSFLNNQAIDGECNLDEWSKCEQLLKFTNIGAALEKQIDEEEKDRADTWQHQTLKVLDSIAVVSAIMVLVLVSLIVSLIFDQGSTPGWVLIFEICTALVFTCELALRIHCLGNFSSFIADAYAVTDAVVVFLDITVLLVGNVLGSAGGFTRILRLVRLIRLMRILRAARFVNKLREKAESYRQTDDASLFDSAKTLHVKIQRKFMYHHLQFGYDVASGFMVAREEAQHVLHDFLTKPSTKDGKEVPNKFYNIAHQLEEDISKVRHNLFDMQRLYSEISSSITTAVAARTVLNAQRVAIHSLHHEGLLDNVEYGRMKGAVETQMKKLLFQPPVIDLPDKKTLLHQVKWLEKLDGDDWDEVETAFANQSMKRGDVIVEEGDTDFSVFVIARGTVVVERGNVTPIELGIGCVFGEISWALGTKRTATIRATSPGVLFKISGHDLTKITAKNDLLMNSIWSSAGYRMAENMMRFMQQYQGLTTRELNSLCQEMAFESTAVKKDVSEPQRTFPFHREGCVFLVKGLARVVTMDMSKPTPGSPKRAGSRVLLSDAISRSESRSGGLRYGSTTFDMGTSLAPPALNRDLNNLLEGEPEVWDFSAPCLIAADTVETDELIVFSSENTYRVVFSEGSRFVASHAARFGPSAPRSNLGSTHGVGFGEASDEDSSDEVHALPTVGFTGNKPRKNSLTQLDALNVTMSLMSGDRRGGGRFQENGSTEFKKEEYDMVKKAMSTLAIHDLEASPCPSVAEGVESESELQPPESESG
eukprot:CAMPEP_0118861900 /NCGR_PEP_ID=MMETSP1163-20130328/7276_1 /TAXON_ID=124430 /ORGANISM="Phaeomonas parva, Strain CCMP2877" /LENGTH=1346 /DNA_ID=CAMNT_0006795747 /DNA_START=269 /DNA_END=4309 /DNA_ORIENTATION=+